MGGRMPPFFPKQRRWPMKLKQMLFAEYNGFADKRIKNLEKGSKFIIDDRSDSDVGADGKLYSYFCMIFLDVSGDNAATVSMWGNVPDSSKVQTWREKNGLEGDDNSMTIKLSPKNYSMLETLAKLIESIIAPGATYSVRSYKYVCPRTAGSLRRLHGLLDRAWKDSEGIGFGL
jgi:hypothetical protein